MTSEYPIAGKPAATLRKPWLFASLLFAIAIAVLLTMESPIGAKAETGASVSTRIQAVGSGSLYGRVKLVDEGNGNTRVIVALHGVESGTWVPHLHQGTCDQYDGNPIAPLTPFEAGERSRTTVAIPFGDLISGGYLIDIHPFSNEASVLFDSASAVVCGDLTVTDSSQIVAGSTESSLKVTTPPNTGAGPMLTQYWSTMLTIVLGAIAVATAFVGFDLRRRAQPSLATRRLYSLTQRQQQR